MMNCVRVVYCNTVHFLLYVVGVCYVQATDLYNSQQSADPAVWETHGTCKYMYAFNPINLRSKINILKYVNKAEWYFMDLIKSHASYFPV